MPQFEHTSKTLTLALKLFEELHSIVVALRQTVQILRRKVHKQLILLFESAEKYALRALVILCLAKCFRLRKEQLKRFSIERITAFCFFAFFLIHLLRMIRSSGSWML